MVCCDLLHEMMALGSIISDSNHSIAPRAVLSTRQSAHTHGASLGRGSPYPEAAGGRQRLREL